MTKRKAKLKNKSITSHWTWRNTQEVVTKEEDRELTMTLTEKFDKQFLSFIGGPTGSESYYVDSLLKNSFMKHSPNCTFCICGGTLNSWARCTVRIGDVQEFIKESLKE